MHINREFDIQPDELANAMIDDMMDELEAAPLEQRISFLYEVMGSILLNTRENGEKDSRPSTESIDLKIV